MSLNVFSVDASLSEQLGETRGRSAEDYLSYMLTVFLWVVSLQFARDYQNNNWTDVVVLFMVMILCVGGILGLIKLKQVRIATEDHRLTAKAFTYRLMAGVGNLMQIVVNDSAEMKVAAMSEYMRRMSGDLINALSGLSEGKEIESKMVSEEQNALFTDIRKMSADASKEIIQMSGRIMKAAELMMLGNIEGVKHLFMEPGQAVAPPPKPGVGYDSKTDNLSAAQDLLTDVADETDIVDESEAKFPGEE